MNDKKNFYNEEFDFGNIIQILWFNKLIIIIFIICSIPISINFIRSIDAEYVSEAVLKKAGQGPKVSLPAMAGGNLSLGLLDTFAPGSLEDSSYISKLSSKEFIKTVINNNKALKPKLDIYCPSLNRDEYIYEPPSLATRGPTKAGQVWQEGRPNLSKKDRGRDNFK